MSETRWYRKVDGSGFTCETAGYFDGLIVDREEPLPSLERLQRLRDATIRRGSRGRWNRRDIYESENGRIVPMTRLYMRLQWGAVP